MSEFMKAEGGFDGFLSKINVGYDETLSFFKKVKDEYSPRGEVMDKEEGRYNPLQSMQTILV